MPILRVINQNFKISLHTLFFFTTCAIGYCQENKNSEELFDNDYNIVINLNNVPTKLKFDTGASISVLNKDTFPQDSIILFNKIGVRKFLDPLGQTVELPVYQDPLFTSNIFSALSPEFVLNPFDSFLKIGCSPNSLPKGILGMNIFSNDRNKSIIHIDNEKKKLEKYPNKESINRNEYKELGASFRNNQILIDIEIDGKYFEAVLDTGFKGYINIDKKFRRIRKYEEIKLEPSLLFTAFNQNEVIDSYVIGPTITIGNTKIEKGIIGINPQIEQTIFGSELIKNYNWIIDFNDEKVFIKKIKRLNPSNVVEKLKSSENLVIAINNKLTVIYSKNNDYKVGTVIKSVNNIEVNNKNICEIEELLRKNSTDWSNLSIKI